jgi:plastocyanin
MKRLAYLATLVVIGAVTLVPAAGAQQNPSAWSVAIEDFYFEPPDAGIASGDKITWINEGSAPHTVTADDGSFDSGVLNPGESYTVTFLGPGTVTYHCAIHPNMVGSVTSGEAGGSMATPTEEAPSVGVATPEYSETPSMPSMGSGY